MEIKILENLKGSSMGLYDNRSLEQSSITAEKVIDVTEFCPESKRCVIKYARVTRGLIAKICDWLDGFALGAEFFYSYGRHFANTSFISNLARLERVLKSPFLAVSILAQRRLKAYVF